MIARLVRRPLPVAFAAILLLAGARCRSPFASDHLRQARRDLAAAEASWRTQKTGSYAYTVQPVCFCAGAVPIRVAVTNGQVASRVYVQTGQPVPADQFLELGTVETLFRVVSDAIGRAAARIDAEYDARGVPTAVSIDYSENVADEEFGWRITDFSQG